jgi:hypothetical protein
MIGAPCPRCARSTDEGDRFFGPCTACRAELRAMFSGEAPAAVSEAAYEPKMNVVPNQVATKD